MCSFGKTEKMECIIEIPENVFFAALMLAETDSEIQDAEQAVEEQLDEAQWEIWEEILENEKLIAFSFTQDCDCPMTLILHPSTYPDVDWQLSRFTYEGVPDGHHSFRRSYLGALFEELMDYSRVGGLVRVIYKD